MECTFRLIGVQSSDFETDFILNNLVKMEFSEEETCKPYRSNVQ